MAEADAVAWLNREMRGLAPSRASGTWTQRVAESGAADPQHVETRLAELHRRIRSARSEHAAEIETQIQRARANVPQAAEQAQQVAREATHFRAALQALHHSEPPAALACVHRLTDIQHRMQHARDLLQAADAWSYVEADVHAHIQERDYARAAQRIADVRDSLAQFAHSEHVSAQTAVLARLSDTLLREVQPVLAAAITSGDVDAMELCAAVYARLQQDDALAELYLPARAERVHRVWADTDATLPAKMAQLGDALVALTDEEVHTFAPRLFGNEAAVVVAHTLATLSPSLATCVATAQAPLPDMVQAYEVAHAWAARLEALMRGATTQPVVQLRGSRDWRPCIEEAFAPFKAAYRALEEAYIEQAWSDTQPSFATQLDRAMVSSLSDDMAPWLQCVTLVAELLHDQVMLARALRTEALQRAHALGAPLSDTQAALHASLDPGVAHRLSSTMDLLRQRYQSHARVNAPMHLAQADDLDALHDWSLIRAGAKMLGVVREAGEAMDTALHAAQRLVMELVLTVFRQHLDMYVAHGAWREHAPARTDPRVPMPTFSLSPTEGMVRLGEGLLNLPRLFEALVEREWANFAYGVHALDDERPRKTRTLSAKMLTHDMPDDTLDYVLSAWLRSLTLALLASLQQDALPRIVASRECDRAQLAADLDYLSTIASALNASSSALREWVDVLQLDARAASALSASSPLRASRAFALVWTT